MANTFDYQRGMREVVEFGDELQAGANGGRVHSLGNGTCGCPACSGQWQQMTEDDSVVFVRPAQDASVDGQGGSIRDKPVFTIEQVAFQLNRGDGLITEDGVTYRSGAEWFGAKGPADNNYYTLPVSKADGDGSLDTLNFGFYETLLTLPEPYIFRNTAGNLQYGRREAQGFSTLSEAQRVAARDAIQTWDDLIAVTFKETPFQQGDINFMNTTTGPAQASAYLPYDYGSSSTLNSQGKRVSLAEISGDVYIRTPTGPGANTSNLLFDEGQYGLTTLIHEIGHAIGLEHPGDYNFAPGFEVVYEGKDGAPYYQDSNQYSIMSYWDSEETGANHVDWTLLTYRYPSTPMVHDVAAIQRVYGADMTTRTGDTVYGFNSNAGRDSYDFKLTPEPVVTIWDAGGIDTLDLSGFTTSSVVDLNPGAYSSAGGIFSDEIPTLAAINARRAALGLSARSQATYDFYIKNLTGDTYNNGLMKDNIGIAYGAVIENAVGGAGDDVLVGNAVANFLDGGAGDDKLSGGAGDDRLEGGLGADTLDGGEGFDTVSYRSATQGMTFNATTRTFNGASASGDVYISIEAFEGTNFADVMNGSNAADALSGGGGDDRLIGGSGSDTLSGGTGNDKLDGGIDSDALNGDAGDDDLIGGLGDDVLNGGAGSDVLNGGTGNDVMNGGAGDDMMTGGVGNDVFLFTESGGRDKILDFRKGQDKIDLSDLDAKVGTTALDAFSFVGTRAFSNVAGELRAYKEGNVNYLAGDVNGDGVADFTIATGGVLIGASDIIFI